MKSKKRGKELAKEMEANLPPHKTVKYRQEIRRRAQKNEKTARALQNRKRLNKDD